MIMIVALLIAGSANDHDRGDFVHCVLDASLRRQRRVAATARQLLAQIEFHFYHADDALVGLHKQRN